MLGQRGEEREQEVALMKEKMARMEEALARTTSSNTGSGGGRRRRPLYRPPPVYLSQNESHHRGSVHDRLAPPIEDGQAKEVVVFRQPVPSTQRRSGSDRAQSQSRVSSASCTSTYTTGSYEHSHGTESHETVPLEVRLIHLAGGYRGRSPMLGKAPQGSLNDGRDVQKNAYGKAISVQI